MPLPRGVDAAVTPVQLIHRGKIKRLIRLQRCWLRRRQAVEPAIGHAKHNHGLQRCWLKGSEGDALHTVLCAAGYNLRWLLRAIARLGIAAVFLCLQFLAALFAGRCASNPKPSAAMAPTCSGS